MARVLRERIEMTGLLTWLTIFNLDPHQVPHFVLSEDDKRQWMVRNHFWRGANLSSGDSRGCSVADFKQGFAVFTWVAFLGPRGPLGTPSSVRAKNLNHL